VEAFRSHILCLSFDVEKCGGQWDSVSAVYRCEVSLWFSWNGSIHTVMILNSVYSWNYFGPLKC